jgi:hypothetical protein
VWQLGDAPRLEPGACFRCCFSYSLCGHGSRGLQHNM